MDALLSNLAAEGTQEEEVALGQGAVDTASLITIDIAIERQREEG